MIQMLAHGLSSAALFIMSGQFYERLHTRDLSQMGGMWVKCVITTVTYVLAAALFRHSR